MMEFDHTSPGFEALRVTLQDHDLCDLLERFPKLSRTEIADAVMRAGPMRSRVERELARLSDQKR
jgi:hypothetical protein